MSYLFKWSGAEHHAEKVIVTGTFDDWSKQHELTFVDGAYQKEVDIPKPDEKVLYKFIVDGTWTTDNQCPVENDEHGIPNNVLMPSEIKHKDTTTAATTTTTTTDDAAAAAAAPATDATTTDAQTTTDAKPATDASATDAAAAPDATAATPAAAAAPTTGSSEKTYLGTAAAAVGGIASGGFLASILPGMTSKSTTAELAGKQPLEGAAKDATVEGAAKDATVPGSFPQTPGEAEGEYGVKPLPATSGISNPIQLAPGEKVPDPSTFTNNTVTSNVKTDQASYEKSDALPLTEPPAKTTTADAAAAAAAAPTSTQVIPEAGVPAEKTAAGEVPTNFTQSAGAGTSTAALAGQVPLEKRGVATVVDDKDASAAAAPGADTTTSTGEKAAIGTAAAAGGLAAAGGAVAAVKGMPSTSTSTSTTLSPPEPQASADGSTTPQLMDEHTAPAIDYANNAAPPDPVPHTVADPSAHTDATDRAPISTTTNETARAPESAEPPAAAAAAAAPPAAPAAPEPQVDSRDVSPHTRSPTSTHPPPDVGPRTTPADASKAAPSSSSSTTAAPPSGAAAAAAAEMPAAPAAAPGAAAASTGGTATLDAASPPPKTTPKATAASTSTSTTTSTSKPTASTAAHTTSTPAPPPGGAAAMPAAAAKPAAAVEKAKAAVSSASGSKATGTGAGAGAGSGAAAGTAAKKEKRKSFLARLKEKLK